jgi:phage/plasmid primase-like uncharacterized protein
MNISPQWIYKARSVALEDELARRGVRLKGRGRERAGPCPRCGGTDRFSINTTKQVWNCRGLGGGDVIDLVQHLDCCDFNTAVAMLIGEPVAGNPEHEQRLAKRSEQADRVRQQREARLREDEQQQIKRATEIWSKAQPILGTAGAEYLLHRGIALDDVPEHGGLRFHPACPWELGVAPCVVACFTNVLTSEPRGIWRRPITGDKPKALGAMAGCAIRLWPDDAVSEGLVIGEGVETTLAAATQIEHRGTLLRPAWAAGSANNLEHFPVLSGIEALTILVDHDASGTGQKAAQACAARWSTAGREVIRLMPASAGADFNDVVVASE